MIYLNPRALAITVLLFAVEVFIAAYVHDSIIRPYGGDFLVVILIFYFLKIFWNAPTKTIAISVLVFSFTVEILQYFKFVKHLGLQHSRLANIILGNSFAWTDLLAYTLGIITVLIIENSIHRTPVTRLS